MRLSKLANSFEEATYTVSRTVTRGGVFLQLGMMIVITTDVCLRYFFNRPIFGSTDIVSIMVIVVVFTGVAYTQMRGRHVAVDLVYQHLPHRWQRALETFNRFVALLFFGMMSWRSIVMANIYLVSQQETEAFGIIIYPFIFLIAFGFALISLVLLIQLVYCLTSGVKGEVK